MPNFSTQISFKNGLLNIYGSFHTVQILGGDQKLVTARTVLKLVLVTQRDFTRDGRNHLGGRGESGVQGLHMGAFQIQAPE